MTDSVGDGILRFLKAKLPGYSDLKVRDVRKATEGFSYQTILFSASWKRAGKPNKKEFVIRIEPGDTSAVGPCDLRSQFRLLKNLEQSQIPVPKVLWFESTGSYLGKPFFVMEKIEGDVPTPWNVERMNEAMRKRISEEFVKILTYVHATDLKEKNLSFMSRDLKEDPVEREIERWYKIARRMQLKREPILTEAYLWLKENKPEFRKLSLCHGDFRLGNFIWHQNRIVAVLDWEISSLSDPMSDLGWLCLKCWRISTRPELMTGLLERDELYSLYKKYSGEEVDPERVFFWEVLGNLHMATILLQAFHGFSEGGFRDVRLLPMEEFLYRPILQEITTLLKF